MSDFAISSSTASISSTTAQTQTPPVEKEQQTAAQPSTADQVTLSAEAQNLNQVKPVEPSQNSAKLEDSKADNEEFREVQAQEAPSAAIQTFNDVAGAEQARSTIEAVA